MKIGILTFHRAHNYGAFLQCYALQEFLKSLGHIVKIIDYEPDYFKNDYSVLKIPNYESISLYRKVRRFLGAIVLSIPRYIRKKTFLNAIDSYIELDKNHFSVIDEVDFSGYDFIFFGSDQIFNIKLTHGIDKVFWGDFSFDGKKIAYAASAGDNFDLLESYSEEVKRLLSDFLAISVREKKLENYLFKIGIKSQLMIDPTFLLGSEHWTEFAGSPQKSKKNYLLLYMVKSSEEAIKISEKIAKALNLEVKRIYSYMTTDYRSWFNAGCSPKDFVCLFRDAQFIVTTSFHGTAFAINLKKQFYTINYGEPNSRVETLLEQCKLLNRYLFNENDINLSENIKYNIDMLEKQKENAYKYIKSLTEVGEHQNIVENIYSEGGGYKCIVNISCAPSSFKWSSFLEAA